MNDKNIEVWLRIFEAICTLHSSSNGQGTVNAEQMTNEIYDRLMVKYKHEHDYGTGTFTYTGGGDTKTGENWTGTSI